MDPIINKPIRFHLTRSSSVFLNARPGLSPQIISQVDPGFVSFAWDPNSEPDVGSYALYYGTNSMQYLSHKRLGNLTQGTLNDLRPGVTYYFAVTASDTSCLESDFSDEVVATISDQPVSGTPSLDPVVISEVSYSKAKDPDDCREYLYTSFTFKGKPATQYIVERKSGNGAWESMETFNVRPSDTDPTADRSIFCSYRMLSIDAPLILLYRVKTVTE